MISAFALGVILTALGATDFRVQSGVVTNTEAGVQTIQLGQPNVAVASLSIVPAIALSARRREWSIGVNYSLRLFRRFELEERPAGATNTTSLNRFLFYHSTGANMSFQLAKGWGFAMNADMSLGELDLPNAPGLLGQTVNPGNPNMPGNPAMPANVITASDTVETLTVNARASFGGRLTRRTTFALNVTTLYNTSQIPDGAVTVAFPTQFVYGMGANFRYGLSKTQGVGFGTGVNFSRSQVGGDFRNMSGQLTYDHTLARSTVWSASAGVSSIVVTDPGDQNGIGGAVIQEDSILPTVGTGLTYALFRGRRFRVNGASQLGLAAAPNVATGRYEPRLTAGASVSLQIRPRWTFAFNSAFSSPLVFDDRPAMSTTTLLGDTSLTASLPITVALSRRVGLSFGGRMSVFGPRIDSPNFRFQNLNATAFVSLGFSYDKELY